MPTPKPTRKPTPKRTKTRSRSNVAPAGTIKASWRKLSGIQLTAVVALVVGLGVFVVWSVFAGTIINNEPESFTTSSSAGIVTRNDPTAANGQYLEFLAPSAPSTPPPTTGGGTAIIPSNASVCSGRDANGDVPAGQWPGPACTGVKPGTQLAKIPRNWRVDSDGSTRIDRDGDYGFQIWQDGYEVRDKLIDGCILVMANNVKIINSRIEGDCNGGIRKGNGNGQVWLNTLVEDVTINGLNINAKGFGLGEDNYTARRVHIYNVGTGFKGGDNVVVEKSYANATFGAGDPAGLGSHNNGFGANYGSNMTISQNNLSCNIPSGGNCSSALALYGDFGQIQNVTAYNNLLSTTGVYCMYAGSVRGKPYPSASNTKILNNVFSQSINPNCGVGGPAASYNAANGNQWSGNMFSNGSPVSAPPWN